MPRAKLAFDYRYTAGIYISGDASGDVDIHSTDDVVIDSTIKGTIHTTGFCEIAENAEFTGDITARSIAIFGTVIGNCDADDIIDVKKSSKIKGVYRSLYINIERGSIVEARILQTDHREETVL